MVSQETNRTGNVTSAWRGRQTGEKRRAVRTHHQPIVTNHQHATIVGVANQSPYPCLRVMTASGSCTSSNGSPPAQTTIFHARFNSGSSGEVNGNLSIITNDNVSPRTSTPSQKLLVATRSALPALTNCCNSCPLLVSPATKQEASW